jgi:hypothetical protein
VALSRRLFHPSDPKFKYMIYAVESPSTWETLDSKVKLAIQQVIRNRYNSDSNLLNLRNFQSDECGSTSLSRFNISF